MKSLFRRTFRIQYASNLFAHKGLPMNPSRLAEPGVAPNLALLGNTVGVESAADRWNSREFLSFCADNWKRTYLVPAHTELGASGKAVAWTDLLDELRSLVDDVNKGSLGKIVIADQSANESSEGVRVLGLSGWNAWSRQATSPGLPTIYSNGVAMTTAQGHELSREDMEWIHRELQVDRDTPTVLLSHGLSVSSLVKPGLPAAAYKQSDLMSMYPFGFLFAREGCIKACLCGAGSGGTVSGVFGRRFHGVNAWGNAGYHADAFYEYSWTDDMEGGLRELIENYARVIPIPYRVVREPVPVSQKFEMA